MIYKCDECSKSFSSKQRLYYHMFKKVCSNKNKISCLFCSKKYKSKDTFLKHLNRKHKKKEKDLEILKNDKTNNENIKNLISENIKKLYKKKDLSNNIINHIEDIVNELEIKDNDKTYTCEKCNKIFSRYDSLKRHIDNHCNSSKNINIINNTINNTINVVNNITINNIGKENIETITDDVLFRCANLCYLGIIKLFKLVHIDIKENTNLYLTNIKNPYIYKYENNKWEMGESKEIFRKITDIKRDMIEDFFSNNQDKFTNFKKRNITKMFNDYKDGDLDKQFDKKIRLILINNKDKLKESFKNSQ
jgi:hypothetical protein